MVPLSTQEIDSIFEKIQGRKWSYYCKRKQQNTAYPTLGNKTNKVVAGDN
jgi:hypothetical protein